jgi:dipeptidyl aminopeptidase/acylaminoacyl peptidase
MELRRTILIVLLSLTALAQRRLVVPDDLWQWRRCSDPRISADGQSIIYVEEWRDRARDSSFSNLWLVDAKGRQKRKLTEGEFRDESPRWSPDGARIAFLSNRSGKIQIHVVTTGGTLTQLTHEDSAPLSLAWSPDGKSLAFTERTAGEAAHAAWAPAAALPSLLPRPAAHVQVFVILIAGGAAERISNAELDYSGEPAWMPDGRSVVCAAQGQLFNIRMADRAVRALTRNEMSNSEPVPSPDGNKIAWIAKQVKPQNYVVRRLFVMNADGSRDRMLSGTLDRDVMHPQWSNDSRTVYFIADDRGATHLYAGRNDGTARQATTRNERLRWFSLADNGRAVTVRTTSTEGGNVITFTTDVPGGVVTLAEPNDALMAERHLAAVEEIQFESDGKTIQAFLTKPPQFDAAKKYPLLLDIHDAPRAMCDAGFHLRAQVFASAGYVVLCANPRGTPGYGEEFGHLLRTRLPGDDADDLLRGVEYVLKQGYIDPKRVAMTGGVTAAWLLGHTDRFTRAVVRRPIVDWAADVPRAMQSLGVTPWEEPEVYAKRSPIYYASGFQTPTLVIAGEHDPDSEQLFFALQQRKVDSAMVRITGNLVLELQATLGWLAK